MSINALAFREIAIVMKYNSLNALIRPLSRTQSGAVAFKRHAEDVTKRVTSLGHILDIWFNTLFCSFYLDSREVPQANSKKTF